MKSVKHIKSFEMPVDISDLFPLFSPEGEKHWVPGWDYKNLMGNTELSEDYIFLTSTHDHAAAEAIWLVKHYDGDAHEIELYKIEPEQKVAVVKIKCRALGPKNTEVEVVYEYTALSAAGEEFVSGFTSSAYDDFIGRWQALLTDYFDQ